MSTSVNSIVEVLGFAREPGWLPWAVQYFFLIGLSTAAFFLSLPGLVWRRPAWRGIGRRALLAALVCGLSAPVALLADLHQPGRFMNFYLHPNLGSWMAWGSFFIPLYLFGLALYAWLCLRPTLANIAAEADTPPRMAALYRWLAYGGHDNAGAIRLAALVAALGAALILLYTGMEVMVVRARLLWNTALLPLLFALSAFTGGLGIIALFEGLARQRASAPLLNRWLVYSQWATLLLLGAWFGAGISGLSPAAAGMLDAVHGSRGWLQTLAWLLASILVLLWVARYRSHGLLLPAMLALHSAWLLRWIVFMGGQSIPKLGATGYPYVLSMRPDSLVGIVGTAGLCFAIYIVLTSFMRWDDTVKA
ncbi:NrfD/PsrC family molybdoenzyme membrane anchor subunit [Massilia sp. YIM B04103]|uniref:NrfD/PsrC family molybdoenzyme membrane anchor subunit n=1 Tax=Massilia sp. YIM B04103 TaxID=2963106 RepID=UPI0021088F68|nr:NrfD/PsrC family molybdoenzyme membrane anchor subunit [Massilia sp. YIM B04103]